MKKLFVILSLLVATNANAGILLEPYVGYQIGQLKDSADNKPDVTGMGYGARVGFTLPLVFFAFDYSAAALDYEYQSTKLDADYTAMAAVVGVSLPLIRLWAGYNFSAELDVDGDTYKGAGMKAGLGFKLPVLPISLNAEYIINDYDEKDPGTTQGVDHTGVFVSISAPLDL